MAARCSAALPACSSMSLNAASRRAATSAVSVPRLSRSAVSSSRRLTRPSRRSINSRTTSSRSPCLRRNDSISDCRVASSRAADTCPASSRARSRSILLRTCSTSRSDRFSSRERSPSSVSVTTISSLSSLARASRRASSATSGRLRRRWSRRPSSASRSASSSSRSWLCGDAFTAPNVSPPGDLCRMVDLRRGAERGNQGSFGAMKGGSMDGEADREFARLAGEYLDDRAQRHPELATSLGDHRFDDRLGDPSPAARADERRSLDGWAARLDTLDVGALSAEHRVDAAMMADSVARQVFELDELAEHTWNPLLANPGRAIYQLLARDFAPLPDRLASVAGRLAEVPAALAEARRQLGAMPRVHLETAIGQFDGTIALVGKEIDAALAAAPSCGPRLAEVRPAALGALTGRRP